MIFFHIRKNNGLETKDYLTMGYRVLVSDMPLLSIMPTFLNDSNRDELWTREMTDWLVDKKRRGVGSIKLVDKLSEHFNIRVSAQCIRSHLKRAEEGKLELYFEKYQHSTEKRNLKGLKKHAWNDEQVVYIVQKRDEDLSHREICKQFNLYFWANVNEGAIRYQYQQWLNGTINLALILSLTREHENRSVAGNWTDDQIGWITKERQKGRTIPQITNNFNEKFGAITKSKVTEICDKHLDEKHAKQFRRHRYTDEEVRWILKELQKKTFKTISSIVKKFSQKFGRKTSFQSVKNVWLNYKKDNEDVGMNTDEDNENECDNHKGDETEDEADTEDEDDTENDNEWR